MEEAGEQQSSAPRERLEEEEEEDGGYGGKEGSSQLFFHGFCGMSELNWCPWLPNSHVRVEELGPRSGTGDTRLMTI